MGNLYSYFQQELPIAEQTENTIALIDESFYDISTNRDIIPSQPMLKYMCDGCVYEISSTDQYNPYVLALGIMSGRIQIIKM